MVLDRGSAGLSGRFAHPTPESVAEREKYHDLDLRYRYAVLRRFVADDDRHVRHWLRRDLPLRMDSYPEDMHALVTRAIEITRFSDNE